MNVRREVRPAEGPFVERITRATYVGEIADVTTPDGCWDIVIRQRRGCTEVLQTGLITRPVRLDYEPGDEYVSIAFKPGVFMPRLPGVAMLDRGLVRPLASKRAFWLDRDRFEIPTFENAEGLVDRLTKLGVIVRDEIVAGILEGRPQATSSRAVQRHFIRALGMTSKHLEQIARACRAAERLVRDGSLARIAHELGYADQPHMTRSLRRILGKTPGEIARSDLG
jgi:hypothetical protein